MIQRKKKVCKRCQTKQYLFSKGVCRDCWNKAFAKAIKASKKKIDVISERNKEKQFKYRTLRLEYLKDYPMCEFEGCTSPAEEIHHKAHRVGENLYKHFMSICPKHHRWIHDNPEEATRLGYLISKFKSQVDENNNISKEESTDINTNDS